MTDLVPLAALQFELAMAIGSSLELDDMLRAVARVLFRTLDISAMAIYADVPHESARLIFQLPRNTALPGHFAGTVTDGREAAGTQCGTVAFESPGVPSVDGAASQAGQGLASLRLPDLGWLLLERLGRPLSTSIVSALQPLMARLAHATRACLTHRELQASHARFDALVASLPDAIFDGRLTLDGNIDFDFVSNGIAHVLGESYIRARCLPRDVLDLQVKGAAQTLGEAIADAAREHRSLEAIVDLPCPGGRGKWLRFHALPLAASEPLHWTGTIQDVTARELMAASELQVTRGRLSALLAAAADAIIVADFDGIIVEWNRGAEILLGHAPQSVIGQPVTMIMPERHRRGHLEGMQKHRDTGISAVVGKPVELPALHAQGHEVPIELLLSRVEDFGNILFVGVLRDLTSRHAADRERALAVGLERRLTNALATIAHLPSHELARWQREVMVAVADAMEVDRASIWHMGGQALECVTMYNRLARAHGQAPSLLRDAFPTYFAALANEENIVAPDAAAHPMTREFVFDYLEPNRIASMLDVPLRSLGGYRGVVCVESTTRREWNAAEIRFCEDVARMLVQAVDNASRRRMEARHAMVLAAIGEGVVAWDIDDRIVLMNPVAEAITGWSAIDALGKNVRDVLRFCNDPGTSATSAQGMRGSAEQGLIHTTLCQRDGGTVPIALNEAPLFDAGVRTGTVASFRDIAVELESKRAIECQNEQWRSLSAALPDLLFTIGIDGRLAYRGGGSRDDLIVAQDDVARHTIHQIFPECLAREILDAVARSISGGAVETVEYAIDIGGRHRHFEVRIARMSGDSATAIVRNVTAQRERDRALATERERLEAVLGTTSAIIYSARIPGFEVEYISESATDVLGFSPRDFMQPGFWASALHPDDSHKVLADLQALFVNDHHIHEYRHRHADGTYRWLRDEVRLVRDSGGIPVRAVGASFDVTARRRNEQRLEHLLGIQQIVAAASAAFLKADGSPDEPLDAALQRLGEHVRCDRAYVFSVRNGNVSNTHEWCGIDVEAFKGQLQDLPADNFDFFLAPIRDGRALVIQSVMALPESAAAEREVLSMQGIESLVAVPMMHHGQLLGFLGVDNPRLDPLTLGEFAPLLQILADTLSAGQQRLDAERSLRSANEALARRNKRQRALVELSAALARSQSSAEVYRTLARSSCEVLGAQCVSLAEVDPGSRRVRFRMLDSTIDDMPDGPFGNDWGGNAMVEITQLEGSSIREALGAGRVISTREHAVEAFSDWRQIAARLGIRHFVIVPIASPSGITGTVNVGLDGRAAPDDETIAWCSQFAGVLAAHVVAERARRALETVNASLEGVVRDRTAELMASEARFSLLFEKAPQAMLLVDARFNVAQANAAARGLFGFTSSAPGVPVAVLVPPSAAGHGHMMARFLADSDVARRMSPERQVVARRMDGVEFEAEIVLQSIDLGGVRHIVAGVSDITARRDAERSLVASLREKETLLKEIHHRVKNNLQMISGLLSLQSNKATSEETRSLLDESVGRVRSMALIHQQMYGVESLDRVDFGAYVRTLVDSVRSLVAPAARIDVATEPMMLTIESALPLGLILNELLTNAFKYGVPSVQSNGLSKHEVRPDVSITLSHVDGRLCLVVADAGPGLPDDFNPNRTTSLGMRLVRMLVSQLRGSFDWSTNDGARFCVAVDIAAGG